MKFMFLILMLLGPVKGLCAFAPIHFETGFETTGLDGWVTGADMPWDPNTQTSPRNWSVGSSETGSHAGKRSVRFFMDGRNDDGTAWIAKYFYLPPGQKFRVKIAFYGSGAGIPESARAEGGFFAGPNAPVEKVSFRYPHVPLDPADGWTRYEAELEGVSGPELEGDKGSGLGRLWVGVGFHAIWETKMELYVDDLSIQIEPVTGR